MPTLRAVIFDLWGTLITDTPELSGEREKARLEGLASALAASGLSHGPSEVERAYRQAVDESQRLQAGGRDLPSRERAALFLRQLDSELAARATPELLAALERSPIEAARGFPPRLIPDAVETLEAVRQAGRLTGLIANTGATPGPALRPALAGYGLLALLDVATFSDEAGECKPAPGIFHRTLSTLAVEPAEAVFVGDTPELDVVGPQQVGMWTVQIGEQVRDGAGKSTRTNATHPTASRMRTRLPGGVASGLAQMAERVNARYGWSFATPQVPAPYPCHTGSGLPLRSALC